MTIKMHLFISLFIVVNVFTFTTSIWFQRRRGALNGAEAERSVPWIARIVTDLQETSEDISVTTDCGGSLIDPYWVLTAKHCILDENLYMIGDPGNYHVLIGNNDYLDGQLIKVVDYYFYSTESHIENDIALLQLEYPPDNVCPISVQYDDNLNYDNDVAALYGWGLTDPTNSNSQVKYLRTTNIVLNPALECDGDILCFNPETTETNSCEGDSGGPMTINIDGIETLIGVSHVGQVVNGIPCSGQYSSYTKIFYPPYSEWIQDIIYNE